MRLLNLRNRRLSTRLLITSQLNVSAHAFLEYTRLSRTAVVANITVVRVGVPFDLTVMIQTYDGLNETDTTGMKGYLGHYFGTFSTTTNPFLCPPPTYLSWQGPPQSV